MFSSAWDAFKLTLKLASSVHSWSLNLKGGNSPQLHSNRAVKGPESQATTLRSCLACGRIGTGDQLLQAHVG